MPTPPDPLRGAGILTSTQHEAVTLRIQLAGGHLEHQQLAAIAGVAKEYAAGTVHLTTRQGVEIPDLRPEAVQEAVAVLKHVHLAAGSTGPTVRSVVACVGTACDHALIDSQAIARILAESLAEMEPLPHKFKVAVTGCPNGCAKPAECDLGIMGLASLVFSPERCMLCRLCVKRCPEQNVLEPDTDKKLARDTEACLDCGYCIDACPTAAWENAGSRYAIFVGGRMGRHPQLAQRLETTCGSVEELVTRCRGIVAWYKLHGKPHERFGTTLQRLQESELGLASAT